MVFNTAVFIDIENLIGGYSMCYDKINFHSLIENIKINNSDISGIALKRAYGNWSDPRMSQYRSSLLELGIDPIQVYGFSFYNKVKNVADIKMTVDIMEYCLKNEYISNFVIVSGDGGFASLCQKLHEYGKMVIGCAYSDAANSFLVAVCDSFCWIDPPDNAANAKAPSALCPNKTVLNDTSWRSILKNTAICESIDISDFKANFTQILDTLYKDIKYRKAFDDARMHLSIIKGITKKYIPNFDEKTAGFDKYSDFLCFVLADTSFCLSWNERDQSVQVQKRNAITEGMTVLSDVTEASRKSITLNRLTGMKQNFSYAALCEVSKQIKSFAFDNDEKTINSISGEISAALDIEEQTVKKYAGLLYRIGFMTAVFEESKLVYDFTLTGLSKNTVDELLRNYLSDRSAQYNFTCADVEEFVDGIKNT